MDDAEVVGYADVPELREVVRAHARSREVERLRGEVARDLALACFDASLVASTSLIARLVGVSRPRVARLVNEGRQVAAREQKEAKQG